MISKLNSGVTLAMILVAGVALVVGVITWLDLRQAKSEFFAATELRGVVLAGSIADIIADPLYLGDVDEIRDVAEIARQQEDLEILQVVAADGRLLVDPMGVGTTQEDHILTSLREQRQVVLRDGPSLHVVEPIMVGAQVLGAVHVMYGDDSLGEFISELTRRRMLIGITLALASSAVALVAARIMTSPLRNLTSTTRMLANGRMGERVNPNGPREFRELAHTFNEMASELQASHIELSELNQAKTRFFSSATHELKTPLTASASFTDSLAKDPDNNLDPRQKQFVEIIRRNNAQLLILINDLLEIGQAETGTLNLSKELIDLNEPIERVIESMTPLASSRRQKLVYAPNPNPVKVQADRGRIEQVVTNLISNALKYSKNGADVEIRSFVTNGKAFVTIEDHGNGIHPDELRKLFQPFHRSPEVVKSGVTGVGLGLYVVDRLVKLHGGEISVKSDVGVGSVFSVALPVTE